MVINNKGLSKTKFILSSLISMISIFLIGNLCKDCFSIRQYSAMTIFGCLILGMFVYVLLTRIMDKWWYKAILVAIFVVIGILIYRNNKEFFYNFYHNRILEPINYMMECYDYNSPMVFDRILPLIKVALPIVCVIVLLIVEKISMNFISLINAITLISIWALENWLLDKYMFKFIALSFITVVVNQFLKNAKKNIKHYHETEITLGNLCWILMPMAVVLIIAFYIPSMESGVMSENNIIAKINEQVYGNGSVAYGDQSILYKVGYNNSMDTLGGSISLDDKPVMYVYSDKPYYIRGNIKEVYNGYSWRTKNSYNATEPKSLLKNLSPKNSITIKYADDFKTYDFFTPNNCVNIKTSKPENLRYSNKGEIVSTEFIKEPYTVVMYDSNAAKDYLHADNINDVILGQAGEYMDYRIDILGRYNSDEILDDFNYTKYDSVIKSRYKNYLQLPVIPTRVIELSDEITKDCNSTYGKVQAIKKYLEKNYKYSLKVNVPDRDKDFVDSFLFEEKKGYCTYFASAMAILCRAQGIPARYVEGFSMNNAQKKEDVYIVTGKCAHAWCEVLASPNGNVWTIVDPATSLNPTRPPVNTTINVPQRSEEDKEAERQRQKEQQEKKQQNKDNNANVNTVDKPVDNKKTFFEKYFKEFNLFTLTICILIITGIVFSIIYAIKFMVYEKILKDKSLTSLYKYYVKMLEKMDYKYEEGETDLEFMRKTKDTELYSHCMDLIEALNGELYGGIASNLHRKEFYRFINKYYETTYKESFNKFKDEDKLISESTNRFDDSAEYNEDDDYIEMK